MRRQTGGKDGRCDLPWEKALRKTPPPESAVMSEPAAKRSSGFDQDVLWQESLPTRRGMRYTHLLSAHALLLLPVMFLMDRGLEFSRKTSVMGSLDIKDAFLRVDQKKELQATNLGRFRVLKNLPGQRQGAQAWFNHLVEFLESIRFSFCKKNACLGRKADQVFCAYPCRWHPVLWTRGGSSELHSTAEGEVSNLSEPNEVTKR